MRTKTIAEKTDFCQSKRQTEATAQTRKLYADQYACWKRATYICQNFCQEKISQFWKPTKPTTNKAEVAKQSQSKPSQTKMLAKNFEASFSDSTKTTWNFAAERKLVEQKSQTWKLACWKPDSNLTWKNAAAKNRLWISELNNKTKLENQRCIWFLLLGWLTVCVTRAGAGGGTPSDWKNAEA